MGIMRLHTLLVILLFSINSVSELSSKGLLLETLDPFISEAQTSNLRSVNYCPDNLCYVIKAPKNLEIDIFYDFAVLFFYYEADFPEFTENDYQLPSGKNPRNVFSKYEGKLLDRYSDPCLENKQDKAKCTLDFMRNKYSINTYFTSSGE